MRGLCATLVLLLAIVACTAEREPSREAAQEASPSAISSVSLLPRFREGESNTFEMNEITRQSQATSLHGVTRVITETRRFRLETRSVDEEGGAVLRLTMERISASVTDNGYTTFSFDSAETPDEDSGPARARRVLSGLVADIHVAPGGSVITMAANLTPADLQRVPPSSRDLLAENWFRAAIEAIYRPLGDSAAVPISGKWEDSAPPGPPFSGEQNLLRSTYEMVEHTDEMAVVLGETELYVAGEPAPRTFRQRSRYHWSLSDGCLDRFDQSQAMIVEGTLAGVASAEAAEREISLRRVNPTPGNDEESPTEPAGR